MKTEKTTKSCPDCSSPMRQDAAGWYCSDPNCREHWRIKQTTPSKQDFDSLLSLLQMALAINDALRINDDHVEYVGSMNLAEDFREMVNGTWHKRMGWTK